MKLLPVPVPAICVYVPPVVAFHSNPLDVMVTLSGFVMVAFKVAVVCSTAVAALVATVGSVMTGPGPEPSAVTVRLVMVAGGCVPTVPSFFHANTNNAVEVAVGVAFGLGIFATTCTVPVAMFMI